MSKRGSATKPERNISSGAEKSESDLSVVFPMDRIDLLLVVSLVAVRLLEGLGRLLTEPQPPLWITNWYYAFTYLLTALFLYRQRRMLGAFNITRFALLLFLLAPVAAPLFLWAFHGPFSQYPFRFSWEMVLDIPTIVISLVLGTIFLIKQTDVHAGPEHGFQLLVAFIIGIAASCLLGFLYASIQPPNPLTPRFSLTPGIAITMFVIQVAKAAAMEEPVFRGILWGYLNARGWHWPANLFFQAFLFWISHMYQAISFPLNFWIGIPLVALLLGLTAWRTRSIGASMLMHAAGNTTSWFYGLVSFG